MTRDYQDSSPTIVGGQPVGKRGGDLGLPHGIEGIVLLAAAEPSFRKDFARDREAALARAGISLTETEKSILKTVSDQELFAMAKCARVAPRKGKRALMATAASLAALASLTTSAPKSAAEGSESPDQRPALSQFDAPTPTPKDDPIRGIETTATPTQSLILGIEPDTPTPTEPAVEGIRPDTPTATETWPPVVGITTETPTPTATGTPTPIGILPDTPTPTPSQTPTANPADLNKDGSVDHQDLFLFLQQWYRSRSQNAFQEKSNQAGLDGVEER
jgi:hypothetical protein